MQIAIEDAAAMESKLRISYVGPLRDELAENAAQQAEIRKSVKRAEDTAVEHENQATGQHLSDKDKKSRKATAEGCREAAAEQKKRLPALIARAAEIEKEMLKC